LATSRSTSQVDQVIEGALFQRLLGRRAPAVAGEHDHRQLRGTLLDLLERLVPVHAGHLDIQDHHVGLFGQFFDRLFAAGRHDGVEALAMQNLLRGRAKLLLVIDHQYLDLLAH